MSDLLDEAEDLAREAFVPRRIRTRADEDREELEAQREHAQTLWRTVMCVAPGRLAEATATAWLAEARIAPTKYAAKCCLQAAAKWQARVVKS
jgi:hypothetical protein